MSLGLGLAAGGVLTVAAFPFDGVTWSPFCEDSLGVGWAEGGAGTDTSCSFPWRTVRRVSRENVFMVETRSGAEQFRNPLKHLENYTQRSIAYLHHLRVRTVEGIATEINHPKCFSDFASHKFLRTRTTDVPNRRRIRTEALMRMSPLQQV